MIRHDDPLSRLRHALAGVLLALVAAVLVAALLARVLADLVADSYALRAGLYGALLLYVVTGAIVLFAKVARHESRALSPGRFALWLASLWLWPALLLMRRRGAPTETA